MKQYTYINNQTVVTDKVIIYILNIVEWYTWDPVVTLVTKHPCLNFMIIIPPLATNDTLFIPFSSVLHITVISRSLQYHFVTLFVTFFNLFIITFSLSLFVVVRVGIQETEFDDCASFPLVFLALALAMICVYISVNYAHSCFTVLREEVFLPFCVYV